MAENEGILQIDLSDVDIGSDTMMGERNLPQASYVKLAIKDTGCGMSKEVMDRILEPFYTTKEVSKGTGMGLSVVHGIVENHNGMMFIDSKPGEGSTFEIFFPSVESREIKESEDTEIALGQGEWILYVDDEKALVKMATKMLKRIGYNVVGKTDGVEALSLFQADPTKFDLVITDQTMPKMKGTELARRLTNMRPDVPIVLCSGYSESINPELVRAIGIKEFIMKPLSRKLLSQIIGKLLYKKEITI